MQAQDPAWGEEEEGLFKADAVNEEEEEEEEGVFRADAVNEEDRRRKVGEEGFFKITQ